MKLLKVCLFVFFTVTVLAVGSDKKNQKRFEYDNQGSWDPLCLNGKFQSPIDINTRNTSKIDFGKLPFVPKTVDMAKVFSNGHTYQATFVTPHSQALNFEETFLDKYDLYQLHFHSPSEHKINGKAYEVEIHFVHKNHYGAIAVVGVFFKEGRFNADLNQFLDHVLPDEATATPQSFSLRKLYNKKRLDQFYTYSGSLTTPPCTEVKIIFQL